MFILGASSKQELANNVMDDLFLVKALVLKTRSLPPRRSIKVTKRSSLRLENLSNLRRTLYIGGETIETSFQFCLNSSARKWLCVPATSTSSERVFSAPCNILNRKSTKLQPECVGMLVYCQKNYAKIILKINKLNVSFLTLSFKHFVI